MTSPWSAVPSAPAEPELNSKIHIDAVRALVDVGNELARFAHSHGQHKLVQRWMQAELSLVDQIQRGAVKNG